MNSLPEGIDLDCKVTAGSFWQNGNFLANASCEGGGPKMECCWIAKRKVEAAWRETRGLSISNVVREWEKTKQNKAKK